MPNTDADCTPEQAASIHARLPGPEGILWLDTSNHIELCDDPRFVRPAVDRLTSWFHSHPGAGA